MAWQDSLKRLLSTPARTGRFIKDDGRVRNIADVMTSQPLDIARGDVPGSTPFTAFGERTTTGDETRMPVWPNGAIKVADPGEQLSVVSTSADDSEAGTGAREIAIDYIDSAGNPGFERVILDGLTPVTTNALDVRFVNCVIVVDVGATLAPVGTISLSFSGGVMNEVKPGRTRCNSSFRMVPAGKTLYVMGAVGSSVSSTSDTRTTLHLVANDAESTINGGVGPFFDPLFFINFASVGVQNGGLTYTFPVPGRFDAGTIVGMTHSTQKAATVTASWFGFIEDASE